MNKPATGGITGVQVEVTETVGFAEASGDEGFEGGILDFKKDTEEVGGFGEAGDFSNTTGINRLMNLGGAGGEVLIDFTFPGGEAIVLGVGGCFKAYDSSPEFGFEHSKDLWLLLTQFC